jgi:uncharacterized damage-inducible protein DinB
MTLALIGQLYDYHHWANRRLFEIAANLGEAVTSRPMGTHWSYPTLKGMFAHLYGADAIWLARWTGSSPARLHDDGDFSAMADLRAKWDLLEREQRAFVDRLTEADLARQFDYRNAQGTEFRLPLGPMVQHVVNHATHHRSEVAAMLTLISGSPPDTGMATYHLTAAKG